MEELDKELRRWLRIDRLGGLAFPRQASLRRVVVESYEDLRRYVEECRNVLADCYASVFSNPQIERRMFDTVFIDIDGSRDVFEAVRFMLQRNGMKPRTYSSGRGWHLYVDYEPVVFKNYKDSTRTFLKIVLGEAYKLVDSSCIGDVMRMARVPLTVNTKNGRRMEPIDEGGLSDVSRLLEIDDKIGSVAEAEKTVFKVDVEFPPCIDFLIDTLKKTRRLDHQGRLHLASFLIHVRDVDEIVKIFSMAEDFDEEYTRYQIQWLIENNYLPYACRNIQLMGMCPVVRCKYYPWVYLELIRKAEEKKNAVRGSS